jgi:hypothetical protein
MNFFQQVWNISPEFRISWHRSEASCSLFLGYWCNFYTSGGCSGEINQDTKDKITIPSLKAISYLSHLCSESTWHIPRTWWRDSTSPASAARSWFCTASYFWPSPPSYNKESRRQQGKQLSHNEIRSLTTGRMNIYLSWNAPCSKPF